MKLRSANQGVAMARLQQAPDARLLYMNVNLNYTRISNNIQPFVINFDGIGPVTLNPQILEQSYNNVQLRQRIWGGGRTRLGEQLAQVQTRTSQL